MIDDKLLLIIRIIAVLITVYMINQVRINRVNETESLLWMLSCFSMVILAFFPKLLHILSISMGIKYPPTTLFLIAILIILLILYRQFVKISKLMNKSNELVRTIAFMQQEIELLHHEHSWVKHEEGKSE